MSDVGIKQILLVITSHIQIFSLWNLGDQSKCLCRHSYFLMFCMENLNLYILQLSTCVDGTVVNH